MIIYKNHEEIEAMRQSNRIVAQILSELKEMAKPGMRTKELDAYAEKRTAELGAKPAFKGYRGYPNCLCTSINEEIVHGIPSSRPLKPGDILSMDFREIYNGFYGDAAVTVPIGEISSEAKKLIRTVKESLDKGIEKLRVGNRISDISSAVQKCVESNGFSVIRSFVGHGIDYLKGVKVSGMQTEFTGGLMSQSFQLTGTIMGWPELA
jgi:methionyl aminopeptidase